VNGFESLSLLCLISPLAMQQYFCIRKICAPRDYAKKLRRLFFVGRRHFRKTTKVLWRKFLPLLPPRKSSIAANNSVQLSYFIHPKFAPPCVCALHDLATGVTSQEVCVSSLIVLTHWLGSTRFGHRYDNSERT